MWQISPVYAAVYVASMLFPALATIFKEKIFNDAKQKLGGKQLDIFVVRIHNQVTKAFELQQNAPWLLVMSDVPVVWGHLGWPIANASARSCLFAVKADAWPGQ